MDRSAVVCCYRQWDFHSHQFAQQIVAKRIGGAWQPLFKEGEQAGHLRDYALLISAALLITCVLLFVFWRLYRCVQNKNKVLYERIKEVCRRFDDPERWGKYSPEYVASTVGIKSRTQFYAHFKKVTGLTPAVYIKMVVT